MLKFKLRFTQMQRWVDFTKILINYCQEFIIVYQTFRNILNLIICNNLTDILPINTLFYLRLYRILC